MQVALLHCRQQTDNKAPTVTAVPHQCKIPGTRQKQRGQKCINAKLEQHHTAAPALLLLPPPPPLTLQQALFSWCHHGMCLRALLLLLQPPLPLLLLLLLLPAPLLLMRLPLSRIAATNLTLVASICR
jgi:hypothetical protein